MALTLGDRSSIFFFISSRRDILNQILNNTWETLTGIIIPTSCYMNSGVTYLNELLMDSENRTKCKGNPIPLYSLISQLLTSLKEYIHSDFKGVWGEYIAISKKPGILANFLCTFSVR